MPSNRLPSVIVYPLPPPIRAQAIRAFSVAACPHPTLCCAPQFCEVRRGAPLRGFSTHACKRSYIVQCPLADVIISAIGGVDVAFPLLVIVPFCHIRHAPIRSGSSASSPPSSPPPSPPSKSRVCCARSPSMYRHASSALRSFARSRLMQ